MLSLQLMVIIMMMMIRRCQWWWWWWLKDANDADDYTDDEKQVTALVNWPGCKFFRIAEIKARCCICYTSLHLLHILASATHPCLFPCIQYRNRWKNWTDLLSDTAQLKLTPLYPGHLPIHKICYHAVPNYNIWHICFFANLVIYEVNSNCWRVFINILVPLKLDTKARCLMPRWIKIFQLQKGACPLFFTLSYTRCPKKRF